MRGLIPMTSPCNKLRGQVPSCELAIFAPKSSRTLVPVTSPTKSNQLEFWDKSLRLVPQNALCELFMRQDPVISTLV